jgi:regulatory protein
MSDQNSPQRKTRRQPRKVTPTSLRNAALHYLQRYASSSENLRAVLTRRVRRAERHHETNREEAAAWIDDLVQDFQRTGLLDDRTYAGGRVQSMFRQGRSRRLMMLDLRKKGIPADIVDAALAALAAENDAPDQTAALRYVQRRRLGPYRLRSREEYRDRDLAAVARAGFDYETARRVIDAESRESLEEAFLQD